jgi:hypothetical protein
VVVVYEAVERELEALIREATHELGMSPQDRCRDRQGRTPTSFIGDFAVEVQRLHRPIRRDTKPLDDGPRSRHQTSAALSSYAKRQLHGVCSTPRPPQTVPPERAAALSDSIYRWN